MSEVIYSINGKYFKDWGIYVSDSEGLFDALKRKKVNSYQWAEYHGQSVDLSNPKYEAREITLKCFVVGDNWLDMKENHDAIVSEFQKSETQRLLIEPFGLKPLPYEVYMEDSSELQKTFKEGKMVGVFSLKLIEPNPIKKVLYLTGSSLNLAYNSPKETEIFYGNGLKETASGNVSLSGKTLANRVVSGYAFEGRNLFKKNTVLETDGVLTRTETGFKIIGNSGGNSSVRIKNVIAADGYYTVSGFVRNNYNETLTFNVADFSSPYKTFSFIGDGQRKRFEFTFNVTGATASLNFIDIASIANSEYIFEDVMIEKGTTATPYSVAPEDEKFIIIAGNVDEITGLTTNADVLWEKL